MILSLYRVCEKKCTANNFLVCRYSFTFTRTTRDVHVNIWNKTGISVRLMTPFTADTQSHFVASMSFVEYFSFVTSCFGVWFGISFTSINFEKISYIPVMKLRNRMERKRHERMKKREEKLNYLFRVVKHTADRATRISLH